MWNTCLGKHIKPSLAEVVLALILSRICNYQFRNRLDSLTLRNTRTVTFKLVAKRIGARDLLSCIFVPVIVFTNCCALFVSYFSLSFVQFSFVVRLFCFHSHWALFVLLLFKRKRTILTLNSVQVFRSRYTTDGPAIHQVPVQHHHLESINIIQQTPPTLS